jgi:hypothetical protein
LENLFHSFTFNLCLPLPMRYISHRQQLDGSWLLIQSSSLVSFGCRIKTINIQNYYWKVGSNSWHFVVFAVFNSSLLLICLSTHVMRFFFPVFSWLCLPTFSELDWAALLGFLWRWASSRYVK